MVRGITGYLMMEKKFMMSSKCFSSGNHYTLHKRKDKAVNTIMGHHLKNVKQGINIQA